MAQLFTVQVHSTDPRRIIVTHDSKGKFTLSEAAHRLAAALDYRVPELRIRGMLGKHNLMSFPHHAGHYALRANVYGEWVEVEALNHLAPHYSNA